MSGMLAQVDCLSHDWIVVDHHPLLPAGAACCSYVFGRVAQGRRLDRRGRRGGGGGDPEQFGVPSLAA